MRKVVASLRQGWLPGLVTLLVVNSLGAGTTPVTQDEVQGYMNAGQFEDA